MQLIRLLAPALLLILTSGFGPSSSRSHDNHGHSQSAHRRNKQRGHNKHSAGKNKGKKNGHSQDDDVVEDEEPVLECPTDNTPSSYNPAASYAFEETLDDATATGNRIDNTGGTALYDTGMFGSALDLDGTYGVRLPDNLINSHQYTVSMWLLPRVHNQFTTTFFGAASTESWVSFTPLSWNNETSMLWSGNVIWYDANPATLIPLDTFSHVAFTVDDGLITLYIDGEPKFSGSGFPDVFSVDTQVFALGVNYWDTPFNGLIDEVRVYDRALSMAEVSALDIENLALEELPARALELVDLGDTSAITSDLNLTTTGPLGATLTWVSSDTSVVAEDGSVTQPAIGQADATLTLTVLVQLNGECHMREFEVTVLAEQPVVTFDPIGLDRVRITAGPFKHAQETNLQYLLDLDPDRLLAPYRREAGIDGTALSYPSWESEGLDGHIGGHYLTALALMYASTGNTELLSRLNYMVDALNDVQTAHGDGYIGGVPGGQALWAQVAAGSISVDNFTLNTMWVPWYNLHKVYAGLRDAYNLTGNSQALDMLVRLADWAANLTVDLTDAQMQTMLIAEHGGLNEVFADTAALTGNDTYLDLAKRFSDQGILTPLLSGLDQLTGKHANTQIPKVIGYARVGELAEDESWLNAAEFFWDTVVHERSVSIGGNSVREHFHDKSDFSSMISSEQGPETCNTYNMLKLTEQLYQRDGSLHYIDYYERALYNHILSTQHPDHGGLVYFTPMRPNHYRVYSSTSESMWCCVGSGIENHSKYGEMIYAEFEDEFYVNLFVDSTVQWTDAVSFTQSTNFPDEPSSELTVHGTGTYAINIRYPSWVEAGALSLALNGQAQTVSASPGEYIRLERSWSDGDVLQWEMPMHTVAEQLPDGSEYYSLVHGPIVLAAEGNPFPDETLDLVGGAERSDHIASGQFAPLAEAPFFIGDGTAFVDAIDATSEALTFTTGSAQTNQSEAITLKPFFRVHDSRYSVYFGQTSAEEWEAYQEELRQQAEEEAALAAITLDEVQPGEQQPESDHFIESEGSTTGTHLGRFWRDATGYFSYLLDPQGESTAILRVTYFGNDTGRTFDILIDDQLLATETLVGGLGDVFFDVDYTIPAELIGDGSTFRVKFQAQTDSIAGGVFYVRLVRAETASTDP